MRRELAERVVVAVVLVLLLVNVVTPPKVWWFYWVALGWGAGAAFQGWCTFFRKRKPRLQWISGCPTPPVSTGT